MICGPTGATRRTMRGARVFLKCRAGRYYSLARKIWDKNTKTNSEQYVGYVGTAPVLTETEARAMAERAGIDRTALDFVAGLIIVPDTTIPGRLVRPDRRRPGAPWQDPGVPTDRASVSLPNDLMDRVREMAEWKRTKVAKIILQAIYEYIQRHK